MPPISNPFKFGKIVRGESFCNRTNEIKTIKQHIADGYSIWLFSPRRYGKSSLIKKVYEETTEVITIYIDLYNVQSTDDFCRKYSNTLAKGLFDWKSGIKKLTGTIGKYFTNLYPKVSFDETGYPSFSLEKKQLTEQADVEQILNIPEKYATEKNVRICVAFDEFQEVDRIDPFIINWMRSAFQNQENVSYIFLGSKQSLMRTIFSDVNSPFYEFAIKMNIDPISEKDLTEFIRTKFEQCKLLIEDQTIKAIIQKSNGHPHFTQYFSSVVFDFIRNGEDQMSPDFTKKWLENIINSQTVVFQNIYDQLNSNQRKTSIAIACADENTELFANETSEKFNLPTSSTLTVSIKALIKKDLIHKVNRRYRISNPVFKEWLILLMNKDLL